MRFVAFCLGVYLVCCALPTSAFAELTAAQQRELREIRESVSRVAGIIRRGETDEAEKQLGEAEQRLDKIAADAMLEADDRALAVVKRLIATQRAALARRAEQGGAGEAVSFVDDVAPILQRNCVGCHGNNNPRNGLRLDSFAGMRRGGRSGPLLVAGNPARSLLYLRLTVAGEARMPKGREALPAEDIRTIGAWIAQGAKFDGSDERAMLSALEKREAPSNIVIVKASGGETVSFTKDIAPFMVNLCLNCHSGNNPRGGLSIETFERLMKGGDSGRVALGANLEGSRLFRLVGGLENPRMPQGQARITRKNYEDLKAWIIEGAKFDGDDPARPLRELIPSAAEMQALELAKMSPAEFEKHRRTRGEELWKRALPSEEPTIVESDEFFLIGNVPEGRLEQIRAWTDEHAATLRTFFGEREAPLWKGKLAIFVFKDRFGYEEFNLTVERRQSPAEMIGHATVAADYQDAYVALQEITDAVDANTPGMRLNVIDHVTGAFLQRGGRRLPDWLQRGTGLALAAKEDPKNAYLVAARASLPEALRSVTKPEDLFADGTFSPSQVAVVGYSLVEFLLRSGGAAKFGQLVRALQQGRPLEAAVRGAYRTELKGLAAAYANDVRR